ncbi:ABC transporter substrate-binding protein [Curtobacterium sp. MCSS17_008]|uniref:ABC transporter substrate-binding protein n=1 Tax=Curtobacterium sp. MCSS17_008 TaxID=2175647 RepID=UPI0011B7D61D|nr:ABC transporter substrate-binding protein [Curtobacterium sp. MCSS17_008]
MITRLIHTTTLAATVAVTLVGCAGPADDRAETAGDDGAVELTSCGVDLTVDGTPERAVTLEQGATEVMLALGLQDRMIGTSYLTDAVAPEYRDAYEEIPVLADQYPSTEQLRGAAPDFVYSMRASAFASDAAGDRRELVDLGVPAYLSANDCEDPSLIPDEVGFDAILDEVADIAEVFGVEERGRELVAEQRSTLDAVTADAAATGNPSIMWLYSSIDGAPVVAGADGLAQTMSDVAGATNVFEDLDGQWGETSWDEIAQRDPDVIVLADLSRGLPGDSAEDKADQLRDDAVTQALSAVERDRLVAVPATELDPSVRSIDALETVSDALQDHTEDQR